MNNIYQAPEWLYKTAKLNATLLPFIRKELLKVFQYKFNTVDVSKIESQFVVPADPEYVKQNCPSLMKQLKEYELDADFLMLAMIIVAPGTEYPIHIDTLNPGRMSLGLNIPVINCHDSYTAWYDTEILYHEPFANHVIESKSHHTAIPCKVTGAIEIDRCSANVPHWINVTKPHAAICNHNSFRVNSSIRFDKKIFEMIHDGSFDQKCVM
jgi:hypothetical protein